MVKCFPNALIALSQPQAIISYGHLSISYRVLMLSFPTLIANPVIFWCITFTFTKSKVDSWRLIILPTLLKLSNYPQIHTASYQTAVQRRPYAFESGYVLEPGMYAPNDANQQSKPRSLNSFVDTNWEFLDYAKREGKRIKSKDYLNGLIIDGTNFPQRNIPKQPNADLDWSHLNK